MTIPYFTIAAVTAIPTAIFLAGVLYKKWTRKREERLAAKLAEHSGSIYIKITEVVDELLALTHPQAFKVLAVENFEPVWIPVFPTGTESDLRSQVYDNYFRLLEGQSLNHPKATGKQVEIATQLNEYGWANFFSDIKQEVGQLAQEMAETAATNFAGDPDAVNLESAFIFFWDKDGTTPGSGQLHILFDTLRSRAQKKQDEEIEVASDNFFSMFEDEELEDGFVLIQGDEEDEPAEDIEDLDDREFSQKQLVAATLELFAFLFPLEQFRTMRLSHDEVTTQMKYNVQRYLRSNPKAIAQPEETISRIVKDYIRLHTDPRAKAVFIDLLNSAYAHSHFPNFGPDQPVFPFSNWIFDEVFAGNQFGSSPSDFDLTNYIFKNLGDSSKSCAALVASIDPVLVLANTNKEATHPFGLASCNELMDAMYAYFGNHDNVWKEMAAIAPPTLDQFLELLRTDGFFPMTFGGQVVAAEAMEAAIKELKLLSPAWAKFFTSLHELFAASMNKLFNDSTSINVEEYFECQLSDLISEMQAELDKQNGRSQSVETVTVVALGMSQSPSEKVQHPEKSRIIDVNFIFDEEKIVGSPFALLEGKQAELQTFLSALFEDGDGIDIRLLGGYHSFTRAKDGKLVVKTCMTETSLPEFFRRMHKHIDEEFDEFLTCRVYTEDENYEGDDEDPDVGIIILKEGTLPELREFFSPEQSKSLKIQFHFYRGYKNADPQSRSVIHLRDDALVDLEAFITKNYGEESAKRLEPNLMEDAGFEYVWFSIPESQINPFLEKLHQELPSFDGFTHARVFKDDPLGYGGTLPELRKYFREFFR